MKKNCMAWIYLAVCLCFAGCGNIEEKQEVSQELQNVQTPDEWSDDETAEEQDIPADTESENARPRGERVEFLGSDRAMLRECYIYHEGGKEEILPSEAGSLLKIISEAIEETKSNWDVALSIVELKNPDELRDMSEGRYYVWLQFDHPPVDRIEYGDGEEHDMDESDKFIVQIDQEDGDISLCNNTGIHEGDIDFCELGTMGMKYEIDCLMKKYEKWKANKGDEMVKGQDILIDTEGEDAELKAEKVEFLGSDRAWLQECCIYHEGGKEEVLLSEAGGLLKVITGFVNETKADWIWNKSLDTVELKNPDELKDISEEKYYIYLKFYQPPISFFKYGNEEDFIIDMSDQFIMEIDREKGEFIMNYKYDVDEGNMEFRSCGMEGKQDEIESFLERYEEWRVGRLE